MKKSLQELLELIEYCPICSRPLSVDRPDILEVRLYCAEDNHGIFMLVDDFGWKIEYKLAEDE